MSSLQLPFVVDLPAHLRAIAPYQGGRPIDEIARETGIPVDQIVKLASNENPLGMSPQAQEALQKAVADLSRYPDGNGHDLKQALVRTFGLRPEQLILGNGSNDILELVAEVFLRPGVESLMSAHSFAVYGLATAVRGATAVVVPARPDDLGHDLAAMRAAVTDRTRVVWVANPNNPTGSFLSGEEIRTFAASLPKHVLMVLDEAYTEYLSPADRYDAFSWLADLPNVLVSRSFSKAYGLAGLRVGYGVANPAVADMLNRVRQPFNVNLLAQAAATAALGDADFLARSYQVNLEGLQQLVAGLATLGIACLPSKGNFVLARTASTLGPGVQVFQQLLQLGVITRPVANYGLPDWLRVSVGLPSENEAFLKAMRKLVAAQPQPADELDA